MIALLTIFAFAVCIVLNVRLIVLLRRDSGEYAEIISWADSIRPELGD